MSRDVTHDLAKLTGLAGLVAIGVAVGWAPMGGLAVAVGMLVVLTAALMSPVGPQVEFDEPELMDR